MQIDDSLYSFYFIMLKVLFPKNTLNEINNYYNLTVNENINWNICQTEKPSLQKNPNYDESVYFFIISEIIKDKTKNKPITSAYDSACLKYTWLNELNTNIFLKNATLTNNKEPSTKNNIIDLFSISQKYYHAFVRLATIWKNKRFSIQIDYDLYMNPLVRNSKGVFTLLQQNKLYLFSVSNLCHIICTALSNAPDFFIDPLISKNPYNNLPFSKSTLYNIYFFVKESAFIMPILFHQYFVADFNLRKFVDENENIIDALTKY